MAAAPNSKSPPSVSSPGDRMGFTPRRRRPASGFGPAYFRHLESEYRAMPEVKADPKNLQIVEEIDRIIDELQQQALHGRPDWSQLAAFELLLLKLWPDDHLQQQAEIIRERHRQLAGRPASMFEVIAEQPVEVLQPVAATAADGAIRAGSSDHATAVPSLVPNGDEQCGPEGAAVSAAALRTELGKLIRETHQYYDITTERERIRGDLLRRLGVMTLVVMLLTLLLSVIEHPEVGTTIPRLLGLKPAEAPLSIRAAAATTQNAAALLVLPPAGSPSTDNQVIIQYELLALVMLLGTFGGCLSAYRRISNIPARSNSPAGLIELGHGIPEVMSAPLLGALFAVLLYFMFRGNLIQGTLFPDFPRGFDSSTASGWRFLWLSGAEPIPAGEVAKLLVWSFLAGFLEQLVPDALTRVADQSRRTDEERSAHS